MNASFRTAPPDALALALRDARDYTLALFDCFVEAGLDCPARVPILPIVNPPLWELGHIAWFAEWYILREAQSSIPASARWPSILAESDAWFDSNTIAHAARWSLPLQAGEVHAYCRAVLDGVLAKLGDAQHSDAALYPHRLILAHEDMHGEAFAYTLQTLAITPAAQLWRRSAPPPDAAEIRCAGGRVELGSRPDSGFVFDNEKWSHACELAPFRIDASLVTNVQYGQFVADGGYRDERFWTAAGWQWRAHHCVEAPRAWQREGADWYAMRFGEPGALVATEPVRHVSLYEAQAYCAWARRRLPSEAEWVYAAQSGHQQFRWGDLWEWTASRFDAYPGFSADAYREYSAPYFKTHQTLRGASFATPERLRSTAFRNFYAPHRADMFVGFRTCT